MDCYNQSRRQLLACRASKFYFVNMLLINRFNHMLLERRSGFFRLWKVTTDWHVHGLVNTADLVNGLSRGRSLRNIHFIWLCIPILNHIDYYLIHLTFRDDVSKYEQGLKVRLLNSWAKTSSTKTAKPRTKDKTGWDSNFVFRDDVSMSVTYGLVLCFRGCESWE